MLTKAGNLWIWKDFHLHFKCFQHDLFSSYPQSCLDPLVENHSHHYLLLTEFLIQRIT